MTHWSGLLLHHDTTNRFCTLSLTNRMKLCCCESIFIQRQQKKKKKAGNTRRLVVHLPLWSWIKVGISQARKNPPPPTTTTTSAHRYRYTMWHSCLQVETLPQLLNRTIPILNPLCLASVGVHWNGTITRNEFGSLEENTLWTAVPNQCLYPQKGQPLLSHKRLFLMFIHEGLFHNASKWWLTVWYVIRGQHRRAEEEVLTSADRGSYSTDGTVLTCKASFEVGPKICH